MKKYVCLLGILYCLSATGQDLSFSKKGLIYYAESANPAKTDMAEWAKVKQDVNVSFASDNIRYQKEKVPVEGLSGTVVLQAWKGEKVNTQVLIWTRADIKSVRVEAGQLSGPNGSFIDKKNIFTGFVRYVMTDEFGGGCGTRKSTDYDSSLVEDPIDIIDMLDIKARTVQPVWVSIKVPADVPAGKFSGTISVNAGRKFDLNFTVEVIDHVLPPSSQWKYDFDLWQSAASIAKVHDVPLWSDEHFELMVPYFKMLAGAGQKPVTANIIDQPWGKGHVYHDDPTLIYWTKKKDGTWQYDYHLFDRYVQMMMDCGISSRINCYTMVTWDLSFIYFDEGLGRNDTVKNATPGSAAYNNFWRPMITDFTSHLKSKGWFEKTAIAMDEREMESMKAVIALLKSIDKKWKVALAGDYHPEIVNDVYDYCLNIGQVFPRNELDKRIKQGKPSTYYTACGTDIPNGFTYSFPAENAWISWYAAAEGFTGYLRWAYNNWVKDPLKDSRFRTWPGGDLYQIYPGPRSSIRFEKFIEGIQDYEKIRILREAFTLAGNKAGLIEIEKILCPFSLNMIRLTSTSETLQNARKQLNKL
jgi:hypothetical protein